MARPKELGQRVSALLDFFGGMTLDRISGPLPLLCQAARLGLDGPARARGPAGGDWPPPARGAMRRGHRRGAPGKVGAERALVDPWRGSQAALGAWSYREIQKGKPTDRRSRRHVARFVLVALYTGTRASAICGAAIRPTLKNGFIDLDAGIFYRRAAGERETKKRKPPIRLPQRLLAHLRRWERKGGSKKAIV
jgi:hypothetical protein